MAESVAMDVDGPHHW